MNFMKKTEEILNDLIKINNDRVKGYEKAGKETDSKDADLRVLFQDMASESRRYAEELNKRVEGEHSPADETTVNGDIYRAWMSVKATFGGKGRKAILSSCEFGEDAAQKAYESALTNTDLPPQIRQLITDQKSKLRKSHDKIKRMRDTQPA
jgi:uncharacterized protein (TIGR02284 family)